MSTFTTPTTTGTNPTLPRSRRRIGIAAAAAVLLAAGALGHTLETGHGRQAPTQRAGVVQEAGLRADRLQAQVDALAGPTSQQAALSASVVARQERLQAQVDALAGPTSQQAALAAAAVVRQDRLLAQVDLPATR